jgi:hypothetical protein
MTDEQKVQSVENKLDGKKYFRIDFQASARVIVIASNEDEADVIAAEYLDNNPPNADWNTLDIEELTVEELAEHYDGYDVIQKEEKQ